MVARVNMTHEEHLLVAEHLAIVKHHMRAAADILDAHYAKSSKIGRLVWSELYGFESNRLGRLRSRLDDAHALRLTSPMYDMGQSNTYHQMEKVYRDLVEGEKVMYDDSFHVPKFYGY